MNTPEHPVDALIRNMAETVSDTPDDERQGALEGQLANAIYFGIRLAENHPALAKHMNDNLHEPRIEMEQLLDELAATLYEHMSLVLGDDWNDYDAELTDRHSRMKQIATLRAERDAAIARGVEVWFQANWAMSSAKWEREHVEWEAEQRTKEAVGAAERWTKAMVTYRDFYQEERQRTDILRRKLGTLGSRAHRAQGHKDRWYDCADRYCAEYRAFVQGKYRFV